MHSREYVTNSAEAIAAEQQMLNIFQAYDARYFDEAGITARACELYNQDASLYQAEMVRHGQPAPPVENMGVQAVSAVVVCQETRTSDGYYRRLGVRLIDLSSIPGFYFCDIPVIDIFADRDEVMPAFRQAEPAGRSTAVEAVLAAEDRLLEKRSGWLPHLAANLAEIDTAAADFR